LPKPGEVLSVKLNYTNQNVFPIILVEPPISEYNRGITGVKKNKMEEFLDLNRMLIFFSYL
jgi:hypothetical protein